MDDAGEVQILKRKDIVKIWKNDHNPVLLQELVDLETRAEAIRTKAAEGAARP